VDLCRLGPIALMKLSAKSASLSLLGAAYLLSVFLVFRHADRSTSPGKVTIRVSQWQLESGVREGIDAVIRRYEQINPRVHVEQIAVPGGPTYVSWMLTQAAGGSAPDVAEYSRGDPDIGQLFRPITAEVMTPNPYNRGTPLEGVIWRDTILDAMTNPDSYNDALHEYYAVPTSMVIGRILYNKPLLRTITGSDRPPATYRDMLALCGRIRAYGRDRGLVLTPLANSRDTYEYQSWLIACALTGPLAEKLDFRHQLEITGDDVGRLYLQGAWSFDTPEIVAGVRALKEYGEMCGPGFWGLERDTAVTDFVTGHAVMIVAPSWEATNVLALARFGIGVFKYPYPLQDDPVYGKSSRGPLFEGPAAGSPFYLSRASRHPTEALDFLRFMTSQEGNRIFAQVSNWPPSVVGVEGSAFSSQFKPLMDAYNMSFNFMMPTLAGDGYTFITSRSADLWSASGNADLFRKTMREGLGERISGDLLNENGSALDQLRTTDIQAVAQVELAPRGGRPGVLRLVSTAVEEGIYVNRVVLSPPAARDPALRGDRAWRSDPANKARPAPAGGSVIAGLAFAEGWRDLADGHPDSALAVFEAGLGSAEPAAAREARFGRAIALLGRQPVTSGQIATASGILTELADGGADDTALGALFLLARIAQHHQDTPDATLAARLYRRLIAAQPDSIWAQTALSRLGMLELYAPEAPYAPAERVARAEGLLAYARAPEAESGLRIAIASAIFFYHLDAARALPHLLAAERLGLLDQATRTHTLLQIAELSRQGGDRLQAARYYRMFLNENPIKGQGHIVRGRLAEMEKP